MGRARTMLVGSATAMGVLALAACSSSKQDSRAAPASGAPMAKSSTQTAAMMATHLAAKLDGKSEVPPTASAGTGTADVTYDKGTKTLTWEVTYQGLTGPAKAAHFHGPAAAGANAGVQVDIGKMGLASPMHGSATLTAAQEADLLAGKWYINIHTAANPNGEIRGQVVPGMM